MGSSIFNKYIIGKGVDVGKKHVLLEAEHRYVEPGNLYYLRNELGIENYDYLYSRNFINETKYYRVLLYEWFLIIKEGGYIIIEFNDNKIVNYEFLKKEIDSLVLYRDKFKVVKEYSKGKVKAIVIQKIKSIKNNENAINQWTFGIVTNGKRKDFIKKAIVSIRDLYIPQYEIILCGTYFGNIEGDIKYIHFTENDDKGWITKKKNLICENAKYENIAIIHDRIYFDKSWFANIKKMGNYFDVLSCPVCLPDGTSYTWGTYARYREGIDMNRLILKFGYLDNTDWDAHVVVFGGFIVIKKSIWKLQKWDECLFWGEYEDIALSSEQNKKGILIRYNPDAIVKSQTKSHHRILAFYQKNPYRLGRYKNSLNPILYFSIVILDFFGVRRKIVDCILNRVKRISGTINWKDKTKTK